jgi:hypothetical protein
MKALDLGAYDYNPTGVKMYGIMMPYEFKLEDELEEFFEYAPQDDLPLDLYYVERSKDGKKLIVWVFDPEDEALKFDLEKEIPEDDYDADFDDEDDEGY